MQEFQSAFTYSNSGHDDYPHIADRGEGVSLRAADLKPPNEFESDVRFVLSLKKTPQSTDYTLKDKPMHYLFSHAHFKIPFPPQGGKLHGERGLL